MAYGSGGSSDTPPQLGDVQSRLCAVPWYHTFEVTPGVVTQGWWDLRHALPLLPFPDIKGKRCLDIGTWDGFYAFELERRGAEEVVAIDLLDTARLDYPPQYLADLRTRGLDAGRDSPPPRNAGFRLLHEVLGSSVIWRELSVYDLDPADIGRFDVVVMGSLIVHLRDPVRALDAVRTVTEGELLSVDYVQPKVQLMARRRPLFQLDGVGGDFQWWMASDLGLRRLFDVAGFEVTEMSPFFLLRPGPGATPAPRRQPVDFLREMTTWAFARDASRGGHLHRAYRCLPRF